MRPGPPSEYSQATHIMNLPLSQFIDQFMLSTVPGTAPEGWSTHSLGGWSLVSHPTLPVHPVCARRKAQIGWLIGYAIAESGHLIQSEVQLPCQTQEACDEKAIEEFVYGLGGRFALMVITSQLSRMYLDAGGTLAMVFSQDRKKAASTPTLLLADEKNHPIFNRPIDSFPSASPNQFYPAGLTVAPDVKRLLPNHYLDLRKWLPVRHYPKGPVEWIQENQIERHVEQIVVDIRNSVTAVARSFGSAYIGLSAGRDTRMILACSRPVVEHLHCVTFDYRQPDKHPSAFLDLSVSKKIAMRFGLDHTIVPVGSLTEKQKLEYLLRIGFSGGPGKAKDFYHGCKDNLNLSIPWVTGFGAEVGRAFYWDQEESKPGRPVNGAQLLSLMRHPIPPTDEFVTAMQGWLDALPACDEHLLLDLAYLEHRVGCWAAPHLYGAAPFVLNFTPFCHRRIFDTMMRLPPDYRKSQQLADDVIRLSWPELGDLPYNQWTGPAQLAERITEHLPWRLRPLARSLFLR